MSLRTPIQALAAALRNLLLLLAGAVLLQACGQKAPQRAACPAGKVCMSQGINAEPISLDPHMTTSTTEHRILLDTFVGLTQPDPNGKPIPGMAERWETSTDGKTWIFHLREAQWSDGVPVTADDFVFAYQRILKPETAAEYASLLYVIAGAQAVNEGKAPPETLGVRALGPRTLEIKLERPAAFLPELALHQTMYPVPKHAVEKFGAAWAQPANYVSNGAYVLKSWRLGDRIVSVKNPRFWDADKVCVDEMSYYPSPDAISAERRVQRGELDVHWDMQSNRISHIREAMPGYARTHTWLGVAYLAFNSEIAAFRDKRVRLALTMAIDRDFIANKLLRGGQKPAYTFIPPGIANYSPIAPPAWAAWPLERRQAEARRLLAAAGYGPGRPLKVEIKHRNTADPMLFMPAIQADWKTIGVEATLAQNEAQIAYAAYRSRDFEVADAAWIADFDDAESFLYLQKSSTGAQNYGDYKNPAFDALLDRGANEPDAKVRAGMLADAETMMLEDVAVAPIYFYINKNLVSPRVTGWTDNVNDYHLARYLCLKGADNQR